MTVYAALLGNMWRTLESYGVDPGQVIDESHFRPGDTVRSAKRISFDEYDATLGRAVALVNDPTLGLLAAHHLHPSHFGALGHAWLASSNLRTALMFTERYHQVLNEQVEFRVREEPDRISVDYRMLRETINSDLLGDASLAFLLMFCRFNFGSQLEPAGIHLTRATPPDPKAWTDFFGPSVRFGQPECKFFIRAEDADIPFTGSSPELLAVHEDVIRRHLVKLKRNNILNRTRLQIMEQLPSGRVTEKDMARAMNMSKRNLHRKLRENDWTFRSLLRQVRTDLAKRYIRDTDYSVTEIAFLLGFSDTSAFSRAFKGWFGHTPTQARTQNNDTE